LSDLITQLASIFDLMKLHMPEALSIVGVLWIIHIVNFSLGYRLNVFGVYPRHPFGLIGIPCFSFLHGSFGHLFFNSIPLVVMIDFILLSGMDKLICLSVVIILGSGAGLWLFGRRALHVGASCLVMGYWSYLLVEAYQKPSVGSIVVAVMCLYYFGGLLANVFPTEEKVSWEGHLFGFLSGLAAVHFCP
jgi:membrane associated rhomboid family serine protease